MRIQSILRFLTLFVIVAITPILPLTVGQDRNEPSPLNRTSPQGTVSNRKPAGEQLSATFKDGRLSVKAQNLSLQRLADEISQKADVAVILGGDIGGQSISVGFQDLPLDEGLRQILKGEDSFFFYGADKEGPSSLKVVWVYPKGKGRGLAPVPPEAWASTKELEGMLADPDPKARLEAVLALIDRKGDKAQDLVLDALRDQDDKVRSEALYRTFGSGVKLSADTLTDLAVNDTSPDVRFLALDALAKDPDVRALAERALNDPSPQVQNKAREIIEALDSAAQRTAPGRTPEGQPAPPN